MINWCIPSTTVRFVHLKDIYFPRTYRIAPARPPPPLSPRSLLFKPRLPRPYNIRLCDLQDIYLINLCTSFPLRNGHFFSAHRLIKTTPLDPGTNYIVPPRGISLIKTPPSNTRDRSITHSLCNDEFRRNLRSHSWSEY